MPLSSNMSHSWKQVEALFEAVLGRPSGERMAWLRGTCADPDLRREVERMLAGHERADGLLDNPLVGLPASVGTGTCVGPYRLVREIGRGGMGSVYLAERDDHLFRQRVAIKLLQRGFDDAEHVRRFRSERQILAVLNHPNIARLYDGGVTEAGRPYIVMEYVDGHPIDAYCGDRRLGLRERLKLFVVVARAVQAAHQKLIVHRDLKPSNILVTEEGRIKLLDFGIAKLLGGDVLDKQTAPHTRTGRWPMTPEYASPEQVRGASISTASDTYQLGLVLYELLTGHRPYRLAGRSLSEIEQIICEHMPAPPSTVVAQPTAAATSSDESDQQSPPPDVVACARDAHPARLQKQLRGDLDTIVMKALRKEPERRYASAAALGDDVERYLRGHPVSARPATVLYRWRKFVRRHRVAVAVTLAIVLLVVGYAATVTIQARQIAEERDRARLEAVKTEHVKDFLITLFGAAEPAQARNDTATVLEVLDAGAVRVRRELAGQPEIRAEMMDALGAVYQRLGRYEAARPLLEEALATRRSLFKEDDPGIATSLSNLAALERLDGHTDQAERLYRAALALRERRHGADHIAVAEAKNHLAGLLRDAGRLREAAALYEEAAPVYRRVLSGGHGQTATLLEALGGVYADLGRYYRAEERFREALALRRQRQGGAHANVARSMTLLAAVLVEQEAYEEAEHVYRNALALYRRLPEDHEAHVEQIRHHLANLHDAWGTPQ